MLATGPAQRWAIRAPTVDPTWKRGYHLGGSAKFADEFAEGSEPPLMCPVCKLADPSLPDQTHFPGVELLIEAVDENGVKVLFLLFSYFLFLLGARNESRRHEQLSS